MALSKIDFLTDNKCYRGEAEDGSTEHEANWKIRLMEITDDGAVITHYANGYKNYDNVWADRESLIYERI